MLVSQHTQTTWANIKHTTWTMHSPMKVIPISPMLLVKLVTQSNNNLVGMEMFRVPLLDLIWRYQHLYSFGGWEKYRLREGDLIGTQTSWKCGNWEHCSQAHFRYLGTQRHISNKITQYNENDSHVAIQAFHSEGKRSFSKSLWYIRWGNKVSISCILFGFR